MNNTISNLEDDDIPHYEKNQPKLQWLIIFIPVIGAFVLYTFLHIHNKRRKTKQRPVDEETVTIPSVVMANIIPAPNPIFDYSNRTNETRIYDIRTGQYPHVRLSNNSYDNNTTTTFWQRFQSSSSPTTDILTQQNNRERQRRRQRRDRRRSRRYLNRTPTPPPVYSISSPPKYEEVVALERDNEALAHNIGSNAR
jgi:hypothetical protein